MGVLRPIICALKRWEVTTQVYVTKNVGYTKAILGLCFYSDYLKVTIVNNNE